MSPRFALLASAILVAPILSLQAKPDEKKLTEKKPFQLMDYGRFFSATFDNALGKNVFTGSGCTANKGIVVKVGEGEGAGALLFDTDLLRMAGGWTGGFFKLRGVAFDGAHGPNPAPPLDATVVFETNPTGPGWSKGAELKDPRKLPSGPGAALVPFGPIPREWAKYKGLYRSGEKTVLSYTVGRVPVLELPWAEKKGEQTFLTRTLNVLGAGDGATMVLDDLPAGATATVEKGSVVVQDKESRVLISGLNLPIGAEWVVLQPSRVALKLPAFAGTEAFKIAYWKGAEADLEAARQAISGLAQPEKLAPLTKGGPVLWKEDVVAEGKLAPESDQAYVVDTVGIPTDNPYKSFIRVGALDFFPNGDLAFSTWSGDVWVGRKMTDTLGMTWHRFATGLFQPLGLKIVDGDIFVTGRDQITHLHDLNHDGEADFYECFNNDVQVTPGFHEFTFELQTDPQGNFYFAKGGPVNPGGRGWGPLSDHNGCIFKVSKDGQKFEVYASGLRAPNGIGVSPTGQVTNGDNQGTWVPVDYIHFVKQGEYIEVPDLSHQDPPPTNYTPHLCWLPMDADNSCGSQVWVTSDKWGPLKGRMLYLSYGKGSLFNVLQETTSNGVLQGGAVRFPLKFDTGIMRARFNPKDGQLYVGGLRGWQTNGSRDGSIQRVRYTGHTVNMQTGLQVNNKGITINFSSPLEAATAGDVGNYAIWENNYEWTKSYGSPNVKPSDPTVKGLDVHDEVQIKSVKLSDDRKSVFLEVPDLKPVMQMRIKMKVMAEDGTPVPNEIFNTINAVPVAK